jgi:hypothetical protein
MSKNLTRKGLALGAIVALGGSLLTAAPAFAADELTLAPKTGTLYKTIEGETFSLNAGLAPSTPAGNTVQLKYQVVADATKGTFAVTVNALTAATADDTPTAGKTTKVTVGQATNTVVYKEFATPTVGAPQTINVTATGVAAATPATAVVTAFFDANSNDKLDSGEFTSAARTITWVDATDVTTSVTISPVTVGDNTFTASATLTDINVSQLTTGSFGIYFRNNDANKTAITNLTAPAVLGVLQTDGSIKSTTAALAASGTVAASTSFRADVVYNKAGITVAGASAEVVGAGNTVDTVARTIATIDATATVTTGAKAGAATQAVAGTPGALAVTASTAATSYKITANVKDNATTPAVVANAAFKVTVGGTTPTSTKKLTVNGTVYTAALTSALDATSDAEGNVVLNVTTEGFADTNTVTFSFVSQNITNLVTVTIAAPVYSIIDVADNAGTNARTVAKGSTYAVDYRVQDQFGDAPADGKFRLVNTITSTGTGAGTVYQAVVGGKATISTVDANTADATVTHTVNLQGFDSVSQNYVAVTALTPALPAVTNEVIAVAVKATTGAAVAKTVTIGTPVLSSGQAGTVTTLRLDSTTWKPGYDARFSKETAPTLFAGYTTATGVTAQTAAATANTSSAGAVALPVTVADSTLAAATITGASVTVSGKGLFFAIGSGASLVTAADSITYLDGSTTQVSVYSHTAGKQTVTVTSGAASKTVDLTFVTVAAEASALVMGTLPAQAQAGRSMDLSATVTDKWGNSVEGASVAFSNTGVGYVQSTTAVTSSSTGKVAGRLIVLQNDLGTSYLSATLDLATDVVVAKSIEFGLTDADVVAGGRRVFVNAEFALGRTITVTVDGKRIYSKVQTTDNAVELAFTQKKKGVHTVTVRISGGIVMTEKVTTN